MPVTLAVAFAGALGALARYGVDRLIERRIGGFFPWSTFAINVSGCFVVGMVVASLVDRHHLPAALRIGAVMGFLGAYTTFSTFAQETLDLTKGGHAWVAFANVVSSVTLGVAAVLAGTTVGRWL